MQEVIKKEILAVLTKLALVLQSKVGVDITEMRQLSNEVIRNMSVFQDEDSISVAILIYSLSKIIERKERELDYSKVAGMINSSIQSLKSDNDDSFRKSIKNLFNFIRAMDAKLKLYIHEVINQAQIKKGCKLCEHGISVARASEVLGISRWELMHYIGKTTIIDQFSEPVNVSQRLRFARSLFE